LSIDFSEVRAASNALMMEAARNSETSVDNYFTRQYFPEDKSELQKMFYSKKKTLILDDQAIEVRTLAEAERIFPLASVSRPALGPTQPPVQWVPGVLSLGLKRGRGVILTTSI
jgi:hypothetical protein